MIRSILVVSVTVCLMWAIYTVDANIRFGKDLKCYQCNSLSQPNCADFFDNTTMMLTPCPGDKNYTRCRKIVQEMYYDGRWERRYYRDCAVTGKIGWEEGRWCTDRLGTYRVKMRYCHCNNREGCNAASSQKASHSLLFFATLFGLLIYLAPAFSHSARNR